jgi:GNAT superfamily N-acetyltransferase
MSHIRGVKPEDRPAWDRLWAGYLTFYDKALPPEVTEDTWCRLLSGTLIGLVAVSPTGEPEGFAHALLHAGTWSPKPLCYLEDLFVLPEARGQGIGRALIEALAARGGREGWLRLYWQTASGNKAAQRLYDAVGRRTDWVRYDLDL